MAKISKRKLRRFALAERACRATRYAISRPHDPDAWALVAAILISWTQMAGEEAYEPKPVEEA